MSRAYNFSVGSTVSPEDILKEAAAEMLGYRGTGISVMEVSHRSKAYDAIIKDTEPGPRDLLHIPDNHKVLSLRGGAPQQFAMVPTNLMKNKTAGYIMTEQQVKKAYQEGDIYGRANATASSADRTFSYIPDCSNLDVSEDANHIYTYEDNTIYRTKPWALPNTKGKILVTDQSSCFLSEPVDVTKCGLVLTGIQKNVGPTRIVIVIVRKNLVSGDMFERTPTMLRYKTHVDVRSLYDTPPTCGIYMYGKVFKWPKVKGGLEIMRKYNEKETEILYNLLDQSRMFKETVRKKDRSPMNMPFVTGNGGLDALSAREPKITGSESPKGYRTVGGMQTSIYDVIPMEDVERLVTFMADLEEKHSDMLQSSADIGKNNNYEKDSLPKSNRQMWYWSVPY